MTNIKLTDFNPDMPWVDDAVAQADVPDRLIEGVKVEPFVFRRDGRGALVELMTARDNADLVVPHVYQVFCEPGSVRAWVYHERQSDRLAYTSGQFRLALFDLREDSPTYAVLNVLDVGEANPCLVTIPPFVVHGLANIANTIASFVNLPTNYYDPAWPDKQRLPFPDERIPYRFD